MSRGPLVTAIVPTKDRAELCARSVASILGQTYRNIECIVVDDGSTDGTMTLLETNFGERIRVVRNEVSQGVSAARNRAIEMSRGEYLAFLDSDDEWLPEKIARQVALAEQGAGVVYCGVVYVARTGEVVDLHVPRLRGDVWRRMLWENVAGSPSAVLVRRACLEEVGIFRGGIYSEDWDLWLRLARRYRFDVVPEPLVRIDVEPGSRHRSMRPEAVIASMHEIYDLAAQDADSAGRFSPRLSAAAIDYFVGAQYVAFDDRRRGLIAYARSIRHWPWQLRAFRGLTVALLPGSMAAALKRLRARRASRTMRRYGVQQ